MKRLSVRLRWVLGAALIMASAGSFALVSLSSAAAANSIYLVPSASSVQTGNNVVVSVRINPSPAVDFVNTDVTYDKTKLQYVSTDTTGSAFTGEFRNVADTTAGKVGNDRAILGGSVSADGLIVKITFKALVDSGSTTLSVSGNATDATSATSTYTNPSTAGTSISFTAAPSGGGGTGGGSTGGGSTGGSSTGGSTSGTSTKPNGSSSATSGGTVSTAPPADKTVTCEVSNVQFNSAVIHVKSGQAVTAYAKISINGGAILSTPATSKAATDQDITLDSQYILPGQSYSFSVVTTDAAGVSSETPTQAFTSKGYTVKVKVLGKDGKPLANKSITLHSNPQTGKTNDDGIVEFDNVAPGDHKVIYGSGKSAVSQGITVDNAVQTAADGTQFAAAQNFSIIFSVTANTLLHQLLLIGGLVVVIVIAVMIVLFFTGVITPPGGSFNRFKKFGGPSSSSGIVVGGSNYPQSGGPSSTSSTESSGVQKPPEDQGGIHVG